MTDEELTVALMESARVGVTEVARLWIEKGADVNAVDTHNNTPLHWAARFGRSETAKLLIECGCDITALNDEMLTPSEVAELHGHSDLAQYISEWPHVERNMKSLASSNVIRASLRSMQKTNRSTQQNAATCWIKVYRERERAQPSG